MTSGSEISDSRKFFQRSAIVHSCIFGPPPHLPFACLFFITPGAGYNTPQTTPCKERNKGCGEQRKSNNTTIDRRAFVAFYFRKRPWRHKTNSPLRISLQQFSRAPCPRSYQPLSLVHPLLPHCGMALAKVAAVIREEEVPLTTTICDYGVF
jgi:hypothetical protein